MSEQDAGPEEQQEPTAEQLAQELQKASVGEFLVHTCSLFAALAYGKLGAGTRDLEQARLAIDVLKALQPLLGEQARDDVQSVVANLQLAYAEAASA